MRYQTFVKNSIFGFVLLFVALLSLKTVFFLHKTDADTVLPLTLWDGFKTGGWEWLQHFSYTPDNWLLSIIPFDFGLFYLFGPNPWLVIFSGWIIFFLAALMSGLIAKSLNAPRAAIILPVILLLSNSEIHKNAAASFSVSHNISNLYGMTAIFFLITGAKTNKNFFIFIISVLLIISSLSDPWAIPAYIVPFLIIGILGWIHSITREKKAFFGVLFFSVSFSLICVETHGFGLLYFLPSQSTNIGNSQIIFHNFFIVTNALLEMFSIDNLDIRNQYAVKILTVVIAFGITAACVYLFTIKRIQISPSLQTAVILAFFSIAATIAGVTLLNLGEDSAAPRFLINVYYLGLTFLGIFIDLVWNSFHRFQKKAIVTIIIIFFTANVLSTLPAFASAKLRLQTGNINSLIKFLEENGLSYGYGPYHGSDANAVTVLSNGIVTIRPILFNNQNGMMTSLLRAQSSPDWYSAKDFPSGQKLFFIYVISDGEECLNLAICVNGLKTQFGAPIKILDFDNAKIMIWDHSLLGYPYSVIGDYWKDGASGWMGKTLTITSRKSITITLQATPFGAPETHVDVSMNGQRQSFDLASGQTKEIEIPASSVLNIRAEPTFSAFKVIHKKRSRQYSLKVTLPQPAP
jgi:hypothetical protein